MYSYCFREWLSFFYFYCIFGWCFESAYVSLKEHRPVNRGFLHGPYLPLYGSGAILVLWLTLPFQETPVLVYFVGMTGATVLEFFTGEAMVRIFKVRYWDYSDQKLQYKGHICVSSSIAWGFLSLLMVYVVHRPVERFIFWMHEEVVSVMTFGITVCFVYDFSVAFRKAMDLRELILQADEIRAKLEMRAGEVKEELETRAGLAREETRKRIQEKQRLAEATLTFARAAMEESLDGQHRELELQLEFLRERMGKVSGRLLLQNPGARFMARFDETEKVRKLLEAGREAFRKRKAQ